MLDKRSPVPLYTQLAAVLRKRIQSGEWTVDQQIPTELELMEEHGVSRATVRNAVSSLVREGCLIRQQGRGTFVSRPQPSIAFEPLISFAYALESMGARGGARVLDMRMLTPCEPLMAAMRWTTPHNCLQLSRLRLVAGIPIALEHSYLHEDAGEVLQGKDLSGSLARILLEEMRVDISRVEQVIVPRPPTDEERQLLSLDDVDYVLDMERWITLKGESEPFYYLQFVIRGDVYSLNPRS